MNNIFNPMQNSQMNMFNNINNNQFLQMMNQNIMNEPRDLKRKEIGLRFERPDEENSITVPCFTDEKISEVINKYKNMARIKLKFLYNAKELNPNKTVEESGLMNNSIVQVSPTRQILAG